LPHITDIFSLQYKCRTLSVYLVSSGYKKSRAEHSGLARHRLKKKSLRHIKRVKIQMIATGNIENIEVLAACGRVAATTLQHICCIIRKT
jgi:hypothetical protein